MISITPVSRMNVAAPAPAGMGAAAPAAAAPAAPAAAKTDPKVAEAAKGFEGIFMSMLVQEMFKGTPITEGPNSMYGGLMTQQFGDAMADAGGFGFAKTLTEQMGGMA